MQPSHKHFPSKNKHFPSKNQWSHALYIFGAKTPLSIYGMHQSVYFPPPLAIRFFYPLIYSPRGWFCLYCTIWPLGVLLILFLFYIKGVWPQSIYGFDTMDPTLERDIRKYMIALEEALGKCHNLLNHRSVQEVDLREALSLLKLAHSDAERGLVGIEKEEWQR